jgi:hypothetical protein
VLADRLAERLPLLAVADRILEGRARDADRARRDVDAADLEPGQRDLEAAALLAADERVGGQAVVLERDLARLDAAIAELVEVAADRQARDPSARRRG